MAGLELAMASTAGDLEMAVTAALGELAQVTCGSSDLLERSQTAQESTDVSSGPVVAVFL